MSLELIVGPPNSGRTGEILGRVLAARDAAPLLIVPTSEDVARFERDLCAAQGGAVLGVEIRTFASLAEQAATLGPEPPPRRLTPSERLALVRASVSAVRLGLLARSSRAAGFAPALDALIAELQAALVDPAQLRDAAEAADAPAEVELAALYDTYGRLRDGAGRSDAGVVTAAAADAIAGDPGAWEGRPVFLHGFDDLTEAQLQVVLRLADATTTTVSVNYEDRPTLAARAELYQRLCDEGAEVVAKMPHDPAYTDVASLAHLDTNLFTVEPVTVPADDGVRLLDCTGERGEAEAVGLEIARLLAGGVGPDEVIVTLRHPAVDGPLLASVLDSMTIPVTLEADLPLAATAVGRSLLALCRAASRDADPIDAIAYMRADPAIRPTRADWAERRIARGEVESVAALAEQLGEGLPPHLRRVLEADSGPDRLQALALAARRVAEEAHREAAPLAGERDGGPPMEPLELRAGVAAAELLGELALTGGMRKVADPDLTDATQAIEAATVRSWRGSAAGRVRIVSPYRLRGERARFLFVAGLQEGTFPGAGVIDPLLGEAARARLGIPALRRREQAAEERYLFGVCVSRPLERLYLSWRSSDDEGKPAQRSPFVEEVLDLVGDSPEAAERALVRKRDVAQVVPATGEAPTPRLLARAVVLAEGRAPERQRERLKRIGADRALTEDVLALCEAAGDLRDKPSGIGHPAVLADLAERMRVLSASSLEKWVECPYRWFVDHELTPQRLEPTPDGLWLGSLVHEALERLYRDPPGGDSIPRPGDAQAWKGRASEILEELLTDGEWAPITPARRVAVNRVRSQIEAFIEEEADNESPLRPRPDLLEAGFGISDEEGEEPRYAALPLGEVALRGRIDRIDVEPGGRRAILRDYKTSARVHGQASFTEKGKLQLALYMLAAREQLGLDPVAGVYHPLASYGDRRPRGLVLREELLEEGGLLAGLGLPDHRHPKADHLEADEFEEVLGAARKLAIEAGAGMLAGRIDRLPLGGECPKYCTYQAICRKERGVAPENGE